jgi:peptide/nickel transport system substrate-binding protein
MSGWDGESHLALVRHPDSDPKTDSPAMRQALPDRFEFTVDPNGIDIINRVEAGELDDEAAPSLPPQALEQYAQYPAKRRLLHLNRGDSTWFITMNLTQSPFDDIHVRKAMNWIIDKQAMLQVQGGPLTGEIATHLAPDSLFDNELEGYDPYRSPGEHGSLAKAKAAMIGSKYDLNHDGTCSANACHDVLLLTDPASLWQRQLPIVVADAAKIGITFHVSTVAGAVTTLETTSKNIAISPIASWGKDYADPLTFFAPIFDGRRIVPEGNVNWSLVGLKPQQAKALGVVGTVHGTPSVDAQLDRCAALAGAQRRHCYEALDRYLMTRVVPSVPLNWPKWQHIVGPNVTQWAFDQSTDMTGYAHVAVR